jgi:hypothetical protein
MPAFKRSGSRGRPAESGLTAPGNIVFGAYFELTQQLILRNSLSNGISWEYNDFNDLSIGRDYDVTSVTKPTYWPSIAVVSADHWCKS